MEQRDEEEELELEDEGEAVESRKRGEREQWCNVEAAIRPAIAAIPEREKQSGTRMRLN